MDLEQKIVSLQQRIDGLCVFAEEEKQAKVKVILGEARVLRKKNSGSADTAYLLAEALFSVGKRGSATSYYRRAFVQGENSGRAEHGLAWGLFTQYTHTKKKKVLTEAKAHTLSLGRRFPYDGRVRALLGLIYSWEGKKEGAYFTMLTAQQLLSSDQCGGVLSDLTSLQRQRDYCHVKSLVQKLSDGFSGCPPHLLSYASLGDGKYQYVGIRGM